MSMQAEFVKAVTVALGTIALCMTIHVVFMFLILRAQVAVRERFSRARGLGLLVPTILIAVALMTLSGHIQVVLWAGVLWQFGNFENVSDATYFSATTYTTLGTGKHVLEPPFRMFEPTEAANGMLAAGLNTAVLLALISSMARKHSGFEDFFR